MRRRVGQAARRGRCLFPTPPPLSTSLTLSSQSLSRTHPCPGQALEWAPAPTEADPGRQRATKIQVILKWGGALTPLGEAQAQCLGEALRKR